MAEDDLDDLESLDDRVEELASPGAAVVETSCAGGLSPTWTREELAQIQEDDPLISQVLQYFRDCPLSHGLWRRCKAESLTMDEGILCHYRLQSPGHPRLVIPTCLIPKVLQELHDDGGHFGIDKTCNRVTEICWWPGYTNDIQNYVQSCQQCDRKKHPKQEVQAEL